MSSDGIGLRRAMPERMLPSVVAAMAFLASLALAAAVGAHLLAARWNAGAGAIVTVQVPDPGRVDAVVARLGRMDGVAAIHRLDEGELRQLLAPWLGVGRQDISVPLPAVVQVRLRPGVAAPAALAEQLEPIAAGTLVENSAAWSERLLALTTSLQACAGLALLTVGAVSGCVVALATRAGMATRRHAIEIVHGLGAPDGYIAGRFARRAGWLALCGGAAGALVALPVLAGLCHLAAPFAVAQGTPDTLPGGVGPGGIGPGGVGLGGVGQGGVGQGGVGLVAWDYAASVPGMLLAALPVLPLAAGAIGWLTAQGTVRFWLRRLP